MKRWIYVVLFLCAPAWGAVLHVTIENIKFNPEVLEAKKGDTIIWKNKDLVPHTVTAEAPASKPAFNSGQIDPEGEFKMTVKKSGEVSYKCLYHPAMIAKLKVK